MDAGGQFAITWDSSAQDGSAYGVFGKRYRTDGTTNGSEFRVNTYTTDSQLLSAVAMDASGSFVVVWSSYGQDGDYFGVFGRRYDLIFADGFEVDDFSAWSSTQDDGDLPVTVGAAPKRTTREMQGVVNETNPLFLQPLRPAYEPRRLRQRRLRYWPHP